MNIFYLLCLFVGKWDESVLHHLLILILDEILPLPSIYWADTSKSTAKTSSGSHSSAAHVRTSSQGSSEQVDTWAFIPAHVPPPNNEVPPPPDEVPEGVKMNHEDGSDSETDEAPEEGTKAHDGGSLHKTFVVPSSL